MCSQFQHQSWPVWLHNQNRFLPNGMSILIILLPHDQDWGTTIEFKHAKSPWLQVLSMGIKNRGHAEVLKVISTLQVTGTEVGQRLLQIQGKFQGYFSFGCLISISDFCIDCWALPHAPRYLLVYRTTLQQRHDSQGQTSPYFPYTTTSCFQNLIGIQSYKLHLNSL